MNNKDNTITINAIGFDGRHLSICDFCKNTYEDEDIVKVDYDDYGMTFIKTNRFDIRYYYSICPTCTNRIKHFIESELVK